eukprot:gene18759-22403_t
MVAGSIKADPVKVGFYYVNGATWDVGSRYVLKGFLGSGSFGQVCLATDNETDEEVALKKIPNVLHTHEEAKRVLREMCILRRCSHKNIIALRDLFTKKSTAGPFKFIGGELVSQSYDVYISTEVAQGGDLFSLRGQLSENDVKNFMWQLLDGVRYLHSLNLIHRDLKSANTLLGKHCNVIKLGDFGSARIIPDEMVQTQETDDDLDEQGDFAMESHVPHPAKLCTGVEVPLTGKA